MNSALFVTSLVVQPGSKLGHSTVTCPLRRKYIRPSSATPAHTNNPPQMRRRPDRPRRPRRPRRSNVFSVNSVESLVRRASTWWDRSSPVEKTAASIVALSAVSVSAAAVNIIVHISFALAFLMVPLILAPFILTVLASVTAFAFLAFATAGVGFFFISTPFFAIGLLAKALFPLVVVSGAVATLVKKVLHKTDNDQAANSEDKYIDNEDEDIRFPSMRDELADFDRVLKKRGVESSVRSWNVATWGMSEVVDELDLTGLGEYRQLFIDERIDGSTLLSLSEDDIRNEFSTMPLGDRMRLSRLISDLRRRSRS